MSRDHVDRAGRHFTINVVECLINIRITVSDYYAEAYGQLQLVLYNRQPYLNHSIYQGISPVPTTETAIFVQYHDELDWSFLLTAYVDPDPGDQLDYSVKHKASPFSYEDLPDWLVFNSKTRRFFGNMRKYSKFKLCAQRTPTFSATNYLGEALTGLDRQECRLHLIVTGTDGRETVPVDLILTIYNNQPFNFQPINMVNGSNSPIFLHVGTKFDFQIPIRTFQDADFFDALGFSVAYGERRQLPSWMNFNENKRRLFGLPVVPNFIDVCVNETSLAFQDALGQTRATRVRSCTFPLVVTVSDGELSTQQVVDLVVYNTQPLHFRPLANEGDNVYWHHISAFLQFVFAEDVFKDQDPEPLHYKLFMQNSGVPPQWLRFNSENRRFSGQPPRDLLDRGCEGGELTVYNQTTAEDVNWRGEEVPIRVSGCRYPLMVMAYDQHDQKEGNFTLFVYNRQPYQRLPLHEDSAHQEADLRVHFGHALYFAIEKHRFLDIDVAALRQSPDDVAYAVRLSSGWPLPGSLKFDRLQNAIVGPTDYAGLAAVCSAATMLVVRNVSMETDWLGSTLFPVDEVQCHLRIEVQLHDGYDFVLAHMTLVLYNRIPYQQRPLDGASYSPRISAHALEPFAFNLQQSFFRDPDSDELVLSIHVGCDEEERLPNWLHFSPEFGTLSGTPKKGDIGPLVLNITISDGVSHIHQIMHLLVYNNAPRLSGLPSNLTIDFDQPIKVQIPSNEFRFYDPDGDAIKYRVYCQSREVEGVAENDWVPLTQCSNWLWFDQMRNVIQGTPTLHSDVPFNETLNQFYKKYYLLIMAIDGCDNSTSVVFEVRVHHINPHLNHSNTVAHQLLALKARGQVKLKPFHYVQFAFLPDTFFIRSKFQFYYARMVALTPELLLRLTASRSDPAALFRQVAALSDSAQLIQDISTTTFQWLRFDQDSRRFYGTPLKENILPYLIALRCFDGYGQDLDYFILNITNLPPRLRLSKHYLSMNRTLGYELTLPLDTVFVDDDNDTLIYSAFCQYFDSQLMRPFEVQLYKFGHFWLKYDSQLNIVQGTPTTEQARYRLSSRTYELQIKLTISVTDLASDVNTTFTIDFANGVPLQNQPLLQEQFDQTIKSVVIDREFQFTLIKDTFADPDPEVLTYKLSPLNTESIPNWLKFDAQQLVLIGTPSEEAVYHTFQFELEVADIYQTVHNQLEFTVQPSLLYLLKKVSQIGSKPAHSPALRPAQTGLSAHLLIFLYLYLGICLYLYLLIFLSSCLPILVSAI